MNDAASAPTHGGQTLGRALVAAQFGLLAALALLALHGLQWLPPPFRSGAAPGSPGTVPAAAWGLAVLAAVLGLAALRANRPGNFNVMPTPRAGGVLVLHGPYRWIRHPMYTALLLGGAALGWTAASGAGTATALVAASAWVGLAAVLGLKAGVEERALLVRFPGYAAYRAGTGRFLPWPRG